MMLRPARSALGRGQLRVKCRHAEEGGVTAGVPPIAADFAAMPKPAEAGQYRIFDL